MRRPIFVRPLADAAREVVETGLRSSDAYILRRSQILAASAPGAQVPRTARGLSCNEQTVRNAIHAFNREGAAALTRRSCAVHTEQAAFAPEAAEALRALLHRSPRDFGHPTSLWTLELAAEEAHKQGLAATRVTGEPIRATRARLGVRWLRAKAWLASPDPAYARKEGGSGGRAGGRARRPGQEGARLRQRALLLLWDNAPWHISKAVRAWLRAHNRRVKIGGRGVRLIARQLPVRSPWRNPIEPKWVHTKRQGVEPDRLLPAQELAERVCDALDCTYHEHLPIPEQAA